MAEDTPDRLAHLPRMTGLTRDHLTAIGALTLLWGGAELDVQYLIWSAANWPQATGELATAEMGNVARIQLLKNLVRQRSSDSGLVSEADDIAAFFDALRVERNDAVHALVGARPGASLTKRDAKLALGYVRSVVVRSDAEHCLAIVDDLGTFRRCAVHLAHNLKAANEHGREPRLLRDHATSSPHIERLRNRLDTLRRRRSQNTH